MARKTYREHIVELTSEETNPGEWVFRATILSRTANRIKDPTRPAEATFDTRRQADSYAMELAKLWIDGRLWGANGHG
jgi:hypothetical protein